MLETLNVMPVPTMEQSEAPSRISEHDSESNGTSLGSPKSEAEVKGKFPRRDVICILRTCNYKFIFYFKFNEPNKKRSRCITNFFTT